MIKKLASRLANFFLDNGVIKRKDVEIQIYGITAVICTTINYLVLLGLAVFFHRLAQAIIFLFFYMTLRKFIGGWHASTPLKCTIFGTALLCSYMLISELILNNMWINILLSAATVILVFLLAPAYQNNEYTPGQIAIFKQKARKIVVIMFGIVFLASFLAFCKVFSVFQTYAATGMISALITMLPIKWMERKKI